jgi:ribose 5-phosphate isomerase A
MNLKQQVAEHAALQVNDGMKLGLGSGTTMQYVLQALGTRMQDGTLRGLVGVPSSEATAHQARELGIPLGTLQDHPRLDLTIDGADEVDPALDLIKGLGGALLREKMVALASQQVLIVVDESKQVARLGTLAPLPVEVLPFGWSIHLPLLEQLGAMPRRRTLPNGQPYITDNGNFVVDCAFESGIDDARALAEAICHQPGIIEHGLFLGIASEVAVATSAGIVIRRR